MSAIKAVLFDVGNVLITWHPENLFRKVIADEEKRVNHAPAMYQLALDRMGLTAPEVFFTDDSAANIAAARDLGFVTHLFDRPQTLRPALVAAGVLSQSSIAAWLGAYAP